MRIADDIIKNGSATHGLLGATVQDVTSEGSATSSKTVGAKIDSVTAGGAAASAGLQAGDIVTNFDGNPDHELDRPDRAGSCAAGRDEDVDHLCARRQDREGDRHAGRAQVGPAGGRFEGPSDRWLLGPSPSEGRWGPRQLRVAEVLDPRALVGSSDSNRGIGLPWPPAKPQLPVCLT
ncbi:MAG: S1C family serine protease [Galbitalea sp.]